MKFKKIKHDVVNGIAAVILLMAPQQSRADVFGGDVVVLTQILANSIQQLIQLKQVLSTGQDTFGLVLEVNRGLYKRAYMHKAGMLSVLWL